MAVRPVTMRKDPPVVLSGVRELATRYKVCLASHKRCYPGMTISIPIPIPIHIHIPMTVAAAAVAVAMAMVPQRSGGLTAAVAPADTGRAAGPVWRAARWEAALPTCPPSRAADGGAGTAVAHPQQQLPPCVSVLSCLLLCTMLHSYIATF